MSAAAMPPRCGRLLPVLPLRQLLPLLVLPASEPASEAARGEDGEGAPAPAAAAAAAAAARRSSGGTSNATPSCPRCRFLRRMSKGCSSRSCKRRTRVIQRAGTRPSPPGTRPVQHLIAATPGARRHHSTTTSPPTDTPTHLLLRVCVPQRRPHPPQRRRTLWRQLLKRQLLIHQLLGGWVGGLRVGRAQGRSACHGCKWTETQCCFSNAKPNCHPHHPSANQTPRPCDHHSTSAP